MVKKITRGVIASLAPSPASGTKNIVWDQHLPGFGVYMVQSGRVSFIYQYRIHKGQTKSILIGYNSEFSIEQARAVAADYAQQRRQGIDPIALLQEKKKEERANEELVLSSYASEWMKRRIRAGKPLTKAQTAIVDRDVVGLLGEVRIDRMTVRDVETFSAALGERGESARRGGLVYLKAILNDAIRRGVILRSPADAVETPKSGQRLRRFSDTEIQRYLESAADVGGPRGDIYEVIMRTVKRKEEVSRMRWEDLDLVRGMWLLSADRSKNRLPYEIVLPHQVIGIILDQQPDARLRTGPVFTLDGGRTAPEMGSQVKDLLDANMSRRVELANDRDGTAHSVAHYTIHDTRTTGASRMQEVPLGVPVDIINAILLHVVGSGVTKIYLRSGMTREAGDALQKWNDWLDDLMSLPSAWPGGRDLPKLGRSEAKDRLARFRSDWPLRTDQRRARERREQTPKQANKGRRKAD